MVNGSGVGGDGSAGVYVLDVCMHGAYRLLINTAWYPQPDVPTAPAPGTHSLAPTAPSTRHVFLTGLLLVDGQSAPTVISANVTWALKLQWELYIETVGSHCTSLVHSDGDEAYPYTVCGVGGQCE
jgi:hypothetical protein